MTVMKTAFSIFGHFFLYMLHLHAFLPRVYVKAKGRPANAGGGEGAEADTSTVTTNSVTPASTQAPSSSAAVSSVSTSIAPIPSGASNSDPSINPQGSSNSPSLSSSSPADSDFPISLPPPANSTTCGNAMFVWTLIDPSFDTQNKQMEVFVTNEDVDQMPNAGSAASTSATSDAANPTPVFDPDGDGDNDGGSFSDSDSDGPDTTLGPQLPQVSHVPKTAISLPLSNATAITSGQLTLSVLTLPQGWYVFAVKSDFTVVANVSGSNDTQTHLIIRSAPFFVASTGNTSCIPPALAQTAQQNMPTLPLSSGALAGTIVGCVVGVTALVGACLLPRLWRRGVPGHKAWMGRRKLYHIF